MTRRKDLPPLRTRPDQPERWIAHGEPIPFAQAARLVLGAHEEDGATEELTVPDLAACRGGGAVELGCPGRGWGARGRCASSVSSQVMSGSMCR